MGNTIWISELEGKHIDFAEEFIKQNKVYQKWCNKACRVTELRVIVPDGWYTKDCCSDRADVYLDENGIIKKIK